MRVNPATQQDQNQIQNQASSSQQSAGGGAAAPSATAGSGGQAAAAFSPMQQQAQSQAVEDDLRYCPEPSWLEHSITIGDLHGNAVLMLYFLIKAGVIRLRDPEDYDRFVKAHEILFKELLVAPYNEMFLHNNIGVLRSANFDTLTRIAQRNMVRKFTIKSADDQARENRVRDRQVLVNNAIRTIREIIENAAVTDEPRIVRFIGDMLADRGPCDFSTLLLLKKLQENRVNIDVRILLSNHDLGFITHYPFVNSKGKFRSTLLCAQEASLQSMLGLIQLGMLEATEIDEIVKNYYLLKLKLIDVSETLYEEGGVKKRKFYTHAPVSVDLLKRLCSIFSVDWSKDFGERAGEINLAFKRDFDNALKVETDLLSYFSRPGSAGKMVNDFVWVREQTLPQDRVYEFSRLDLINFHGHDGQFNLRSGNLNGDFGKSLLSSIIVNILDGEISRDSLQILASQSTDFWITSDSSVSFLHGTKSGLPGLEPQVVAGGGAAALSTATTAPTFFQPIMLNLGGSVQQTISAPPSPVTSNLGDPVSYQSTRDAACSP